MTSTNDDGEQQQRHHQHVVVLRHGHRLDNFDPLWAATAQRKWDPPLTEEGKRLAFKTGQTLRQNMGFPLHRVFVSPFLRCLQTAAEAISALCTEDDDDSTRESPKPKVAVEYGLSEMMNTLAIRSNMAPEDGNFTFNIPYSQAILTPGTLDHNVEPVYQKVPQWEELPEEARSRYMHVIKALAHKFPSENLLLVTHGEGVGVSASEFGQGKKVCGVDYCGYSVLRRCISLSNDNTLVTAGNFELLLTNGITFYAPSSE